MDKKLLGKRINAARKERGLTGEALSELCDINATYLRQIESGAKLPSLPLFVCLCDKLGASPAYLLADQLGGGGAAGGGDLLELQRRATPGQLRLIHAMVRSALAVMDDEAGRP